MGEDVKTKILKNAYKLFLEEGYRAATIRKIAAMSGVSHTLVMYNFNNKANIAGNVGKLYLDRLLKTVEAIDIREEEKSFFYKFAWFTLHYLIITTKRDFGHFYIEFTTDEPDVFNENVASLMPLILGEMFGLRESLKSTDFEADTLLLTGVDSTLSRLCYEKKLKVNKAVTKLFSMSITEGFRLELDEKDVEDFIEKYSLLNIAQEIDVKALV